MEVQVYKKYNPIQFLDFAGTLQNTSDTLTIRVKWWDHVNNEWIKVDCDDIDAIINSFGKMYIVKFENIIDVSPTSIIPILEIYLANQIEFKIDAIHEAIEVLYRDY